MLGCLMMNHLVNGQSSGIVQLLGVVRDATTQQTLSAEINVVNAENGKISSIKSIETQVDGSFKIDLSKNDFILKIKVKGYLISSVRMNVSQVETPFFYCEIPLVKEDAQQLDQLYLQASTQKGYSVEASQSTKNSKSIHVFQALDGVDNKVVTAKFRLVSTQNNKEDSYETTSEKPSFEVNFTQKDIVAVEVTKDGYQKFLGNLIIETLDNKTHQSSAKLIGSLAFLNIINKTNFTELSLVKLDQTESPVLLKDINKINFGLLKVGAKYSATLNHNIVKEFVANEGINQVILEQETTQNVIKDIEKINETENQVLYFEQATVTLKEDSKKLLDEVLNKMKQTPELKIEIIGHTDNIGDFHQNEYLSEFRAKYVANFLFNKGIKDARISIKGDGSSKPIIENNNEENRSKNRRVEIRLY